MYLFLYEMEYPELNEDRHICSATVAAGVFLALNILSSGESQTTQSIERQQQAIIACIDSLRQYEDITVISQHGVRVLERLVSLEQSCKGLKLERSAVLQMIQSLDPNYGGHSTPVNEGQVATDMRPASPPVILDNEVFMEQLFPNGLDSGGILSDYFYAQGEQARDVDQLEELVFNTQSGYY